MSGLETVQGWFDAGRLIRPSADELNFTYLVRALLGLCGAETADDGGGAGELRGMIGQAEHYVFVLVDGLGDNLLRRLLPGDGFLRAHQAGRLQAVYLSTTATALTTLATARWPCAHGVPGWWTYLPGPDVSAVTLPFEERTSGRSLGQFGVSAADLFPTPSVWPGLKHQPLSVLPAKIVGTTYSTYAGGGTASVGYADLTEAVARVCSAVREARRPSLTYLYLPQLDALQHKKGTGHAEVGALLAVLEGHLARLCEVLAGKARVVITADHGQINAPRRRWFTLPADDTLGGLLRCRPTGEPSVPIFHVRPGMAEAFLAEFTGRFGENFALLTPDEVERLRLLGPGKLSEAMRRRLGTFVGISQEPAKFYIRPADPGAANIGVHGGLSSDEMHVPLVLASRTR
ncbi:MAG: alkaline phosphatase family protein [Phycisphaerae bacterium]